MLRDGTLGIESPAHDIVKKYRSLKGAILGLFLLTLALAVVFLIVIIIKRRRSMEKKNGDGNN